ncbi:MAG: aspartate ammonia-lyase [Deltaproteobacteria bacterium]|nr:aspartate ammonia-lyase [Deltaproteobacteria bacterium]
MDCRVEKDTLGEVRVPMDAYYGAQTARAVENFPISGLKAHPVFIKATAIVKYAAAEANMDCGALDAQRGSAIAEAAKEVTHGKWHRHFVVDVYQAGAGTSHNMNANEVVANRAIEILGGKKGDYSRIHPNDHVNMSQSTNDAFPSAMRLAALMLGDEFLESSATLIKAFDLKARQFYPLIKSGRTHLQDAVPVRLGQEFSGYSEALKKCREKILFALHALRFTGLGATAAGTGVNTPEGYREAVVPYLSELSGHKIEKSANLFEATQSMADFAFLSSSLRNLALEITRIANDLRLLSSGPRTGFAEIILPPLQPGSSIMPGKVNPVMAEAINMAAFQVCGNDHTVAMAVQAGQMELNVMMPVINHNILASLEILKNGMTLLAKRCIDGIIANEDRCRDYAEKTVGLATFLNRHIGYYKAAELSEEALKKGLTIRELVIEKGILAKEEVDKIFDVKNLT